MNMMTKQRGVTLVELMIAMAIGLIIMLGVGTVYSNSKKTYRVQEEFSRLQENGRFALDYIARYVRGAGFSGCASGLTNTTNTLNNDTDLEWNFSTGLEGYEAVGTGPNQTITLSANPSPATSGSEASWKTIGNISIPTSMTGSADSVVPGSDVLVARSADGNGVNISKNNMSGQVFLDLTTTENGACADGSNKYSGLCDGDILLVSDCKKARVFQATNVQAASIEVNVTHTNAGTPGNNISSWGGNTAPEDEIFDTDAEIMKVSTKVFYVGSGVNGPALFMKQADGTGQEIIDGVESLQVLYGEDTDASPDNIPNRFVTADKVTDFENVVAVKVSILLSSVGELAHRPADTKTYLLTGHSSTTGVTVNPPDEQRMRRVMSMVVKLRNRGFTL
jgi:type IV pilus assembly protein PilW